MAILYFIDDDYAAHVYHELKAKEAGFNDKQMEFYLEANKAIEKLSLMINNQDFKLWPDYVFIDLNMPIKSGYDFVEDVVNLVDAKRLPSIFLVSSSKNAYDNDKVKANPYIKDFETKFLEKEFFENILNEMKNI